MPTMPAVVQPCPAEQRLREKALPISRDTPRTCRVPGSSIALSRWLPSDDYSIYQSAGLKDRWGSALFKLLFSHYGQLFPDRSHPLVCLPLLSIGRLRGSPSPNPPRDLGTQSPSAWKLPCRYRQLHLPIFDEAYLRRSAKAGERRLMNNALVCDPARFVSPLSQSRNKTLFFCPPPS